MIELFATDLDGTLLRNRVPDKPVYEAIEKVLKKNKYFVIATGRLMYPNHIKTMGFNKYPMYIICMNGALIKDPCGKIVYRKEIDPSFLKRMFSEFPNSFFELITEKHILLKESKNDFVRHILDSPIRREKLPGNHLESFLSHCIFECTEEEIYKEGILKINCHIDDLDKYRQFQSFLKVNEKHVINTPFETSGLFELTDKNTNKGQALLFLADYLKIEQNNIVVYGDGENDLAMVKLFSNSYVPKNAIDEVKKHAKGILESCENYGVPNHICRLIESSN